MTILRQIPLTVTQTEIPLCLNLVPEDIPTILQMKVKMAFCSLTDLTKLKIATKHYFSIQRHVTLRNAFFFPFFFHQSDNLSSNKLRRIHINLRVELQAWEYMNEIIICAGIWSGFLAEGRCCHISLLHIKKKKRRFKGMKTKNIVHACPRKSLQSGKKSGVRSKYRSFGLTDKTSRGSCLFFLVCIRTVSTPEWTFRPLVIKF